MELKSCDDSFEIFASFAGFAVRLFHLDTIGFITASQASIGKLGLHKSSY